MAINCGLCRGTRYVYDMNTQENIACPLCNHSKYRNRRCKVDGHSFDSKAEADRYRVLKDMQEHGEITGLTLQPQFELLPSFSSRGEHFRSIRYVADFSYHKDGVHVVEDVKGMATAVFKLKAKMFRYRYPEIDFRVVQV